MGNPRLLTRCGAPQSHSLGALTIDHSRAAIGNFHVADFDGKAGTPRLAARHSDDADF